MLRAREAYGLLAFGVLVAALAFMFVADDVWLWLNAYPHEPFRLMNPPSD